MKFLKIENSELRPIVDDQDYERLSLHKWYADSRGLTFFRNVPLSKKKISLPCEIFNTKDTIFDHIDRNPLNNSVINLRICTQSQNRMNSGKSAGKTSKYKGVFRSNTRTSINRWGCCIMLNRKVVYRKYFRTELEAAKMYNIKAVEFFKEFANLNDV